MALNLDASTPAVATSATTTVTTASFTPPSGAVLVAIVLHGTSDSGAARDSSISASTGLTWTLRASTPVTSPEANGSLARVYTAVVATSTATTVTSTITENGYPGSMLAVLVYTGADTATPLEGAVSAQPSVALTVIQVITTTTDGCQPWLGNVDWAGQPEPTPDTNITTYAAAAPAGYDQFWIARRAAISPAGTGYIGSTAPASGTRNAWVAFAVKPSSGGGPVVHDATAALAATGALSASGARTTATTATLAASGALTATAVRTRAATTTLAAAGALSATGTRAQAATATIAATGGLAGTATRTQVADATLAASGALTAALVRSTDTATALTATGALTASGTGSTTTSATLAAVGALTASGEVPGQSQHLFTDQVPTVTDASDGAPGITVGTSGRPTVDGWFLGVRFWATDTVSGTYTGALFQVDAADDPSPAGTELDRKTLGTAPTPGGWNVITFDDPVPATGGVLYRATTFSSAGRYVYAPNIHLADIVSGDLIGDANGDDPIGLGSLRQATFAIAPTLTYPSTVAGASGSYFADFVFVRDLPEEGSTATLAAAGGLTAAAAITASSTVTLAASGSLTATGERSQTASTTLAASGALSGTASRTRAATVSLAATGGLTATAVPTRQTSVLLAATGGLAAVGDVTPPGITTTTISGTGALSATAIKSAVDTSLLAAVGALTATAAKATSGTAILAALGGLTATAIVVPPGDATTAPTATLRTATRPTVLSTVSRPQVLSTGRPPT